MTTPSSPYPGWNISPADRTALAAGLDGALYHGLPAPGDTAGLEALLGRDNLTAALAGTTDKTTRAWKNARDNLGRYRRGTRHPAPRQQALMNTAAQARRRAQVSGTRKATVRYTATFHTSRKPWNGYAAADLTGPALDTFLDAAAAGDHLLAAQIVAHHYGLDPAYVHTIENPADFTIDWTPAPEPPAGITVPSWARETLW